MPCSASLWWRTSLPCRRSYRAVRPRLNRFELAHLRRRVAAGPSLTRWSGTYA